MSEQDNKQDWQDDGLTKLYRHAHQELPTAESDEAIIKAAREFTAQKSHQTRRIPWAVPLATAASLLLVVNIVWFNYDLQPPIPTTVEEDQFAGVIEAEPRASIEVEKGVVGKSQTKQALSQQREASKLRERAVKERKVLAKAKRKQETEKKAQTFMQAMPAEEATADIQQDIAENKPKPMARSYTPAVVGNASNEDIADLYGMNRAIDDYFMRHLAKNYQAVKGRHFVTADFNQDGKPDWAGLLRRTDGSIDLLAIVSQKQKYKHQVIENNIIKQDQLMRTDTHLRVKKDHGKIRGLIFILFNKTKNIYKWDGQQVIKIK